MNVSHYCSECLGLVPMYGEAEENITADIHKKLQVNSEEMDILHGAYRVDNPNSKYCAWGLSGGQS